MEVSTDNLPSESPSSDESVTSLYSGIENSDLPNKYFKVEEFESKLAQTANIEDHVMLNEEEIAKVGRQADEKAQNERDKITGRSQRFESFHLKSTNGLSVEWDPTGNAYPNHRITTSGKTSDRESVIIKSEGRCERLDYESDLEDNYDKGKPNLSEKEESMNLKCNEDIGSLDSSGEERRVPDDDLNPKPPKLSYHYTDHYGGGVDYIHGQRSEDHKITNDRNSTDRKTLPLFYIQGYPHVQVPHSNIQTQQINMLGEAIYTQDPRAYVVRHVDYSNQEQRVPLMGQTDAEQNPAGKQALQFPSSTIHYTPDQGVIQTGFANIPNMGLYNFTHGDIARGDKSCYDKFSPGSNVQSAPYQRDGNVKKSPGSGSVTARGQSEAGKQQKVTFSSAATTPQSVPNQAVILPSVSPVYERNTASPATSEQTRDSPQASSDEDGPKPKTNQGFLIRGRPRKSTLPKNEGGVQCNVCNKTFGSSSALAKHKLTHSDERRYICPICSKGFKRQDHLNGHKVTHQDKKPYECSVPDCDKSYCDMRSLRRHLENHHAAGQTVPGMSATSSNTKTTTSTVTAVTVVPEVGNAANTSGVKSRTIKVENDNSKSEAPAQRPQTLPIWSTGTSSDMLSPEAEMLKKMAGIKGSPASSHSSTPMRERSSNSFSSVSSEEIHQMKEEKKDVEVPSLRDRNKATTAVEMLRQAAGMVQEQRNTQQNVQQDPPSIQYVQVGAGGFTQYQDAMQYNQWCQAVYQAAAQDPRILYQFNQQLYPQHSLYQVANSANVINAQTRFEKDSDNANVRAVPQTTPPQEYTPTQIAQGFRLQNSMHPNPTDPTSIALAAAKDIGNFRFTRDNYSSVHPSGAQWQSVRFDTVPTYSDSPSREHTVPMGNVNKVTHPYQEAQPSNRMNKPNYSRESEHLHQQDLRWQQHISDTTRSNDLLEPPVKRLCKSPVYESRLVDNNANETQSCSNASERTKNSEENVTRKKSDGFFRNPLDVVSPQRKKHRPEPLIIPESVSTAYMPNKPTRPCTPPMYTPPPMLSPRSIFSHLAGAGALTPRSGGPPQLPLTPSRLLLTSRSRRSSTEDEEPLPFPEPKINVGSQFQAEVPDFVLPKRLAEKDKHGATLCWAPTEETRNKKEEIEAFLDMASSVAVFGGSSNKEYALHILYRANGNVKDAVRYLLCKKNIFHQKDSISNYHYEGTTKWSTKERQAFRQAFRTKGKDFNDIHKEVGKSQQDCVEFYYLWKATHPEAIRGRTRYAESESEEEDTSSETSNHQALFECDFPHCNSKFVSRQALNGHIRVHGGSFMKPSDRKPKPRNPVTNNSSTSQHIPVPRKRKPAAAAAPSTQPTVQDGPLPEFACKVCGRIFHKIKSRSAHMKTHVKRTEDHEIVKNASVSTNTISVQH